MQKKDFKYLHTLKSEVKNNIFLYIIPIVQQHQKYLKNPFN